MTQRVSEQIDLSHLPPTHYVLAVGLDREFYSIPFLGFPIVDAVDQAGLRRFLAQREPAVLMLGPQLSSEQALNILAEVIDRHPKNRTVNIILSAGTDTSSFQDLVSEDRVFYLTRAGISAQQLISVFRAAVRHYQYRVDGRGNQWEQGGLLDFCIRLSIQQDLVSATGLLIDAADTLVQSEHTQCLFYDSVNEVLTVLQNERGDQRVEAASAGIVAYVARTGDPVRLEKAIADPRFDAEADDLGALEEARYLAVPVFGTGGPPIAVLACARDRRSEPFSQEEEQTLLLLAECAAPTLSMIAWQSRLQDVLRNRIQISGGRDVFREEALQHHTKTWDEEGALLREAAPWLRRTHLLTVTLMFIGLIFAVFAKVKENATGPVVIRARNKIAVASTTGGLIRSVEVAQGDRVHQGDLLVQLQAPDGAATTERLRDQLRAPADGIVGDIRVQAGERLDPGEAAVNVINEKAGFEMVAMLPGSYAPQLKAGMVCVVKLAGYPDSHELIPIDQIGSEIVGPKEAARFAGKSGGDTLTVPGPVVIARAFRLPEQFQSGKKILGYRDGMTGDAEVAVRSEPLFINMLPGVKELWRR